LDYAKSTLNIEVLLNHLNIMKVIEMSSITGSMNRLHRQ